MNVCTIANLILSAGYSEMLRLQDMVEPDVESTFSPFRWHVS